MSDHPIIEHHEAQIKVYLNDYVRFIQNRLGIVIHQHQMNDLIKLIQSACKKFNCDVMEYLRLLQVSFDDSPLLDHLISGITVGETYFFRDQNQMQLLKEIVLPDLIQKKRDKHDLSLRIWSAGCSTGEEIYTIAMMLFKSLPDLKKWDLHLLGTDLNTHSLKKAKKASFTEWSMRSISEEDKKNFFHHEHRHYQLSDSIRDLVLFDYLNLQDDSYPSIFNGTSAQDLILCRNVLIYFDDSTTRSLMKKIGLSLVEEGYLLLGASDPVRLEETGLVSFPKKPSLFIKKSMDSSLTQSVEVKKSTVTPSKKKSSLPVLKKSMPVMKTSSGSLPKQDDVFSLANSGKLKEAAELCKKQISLKATDKQSYFIYAMILVELNQLNEAKKSLKQTLFLDPDFVLGHFQLGLLLLRQKQQEAGLKSLHNALSIVKTKNPLTEVTESPGLNYGRLAEILTNEIELHEGSKEKND